MVKALEALGVDGMSDVEDAEASHTWRIQTMEWRSLAVTMWLRSLDAYEYEAAIAQHLVCVRDGRGGQRTTRIAGGRMQPVLERQAVPRLHSAAYSRAWLSALGEGRRHCLEINEEAFDFSVPIPQYPYKAPK